MDRSRIAIIIPALNEEATIASVVSKVAIFGQPIVVDDGSTDNTAKLALAEGAKVVSHNVNSGYDKAINSGFACANELGCEYVITMDGDGQHSTNVLASFIKCLDNGVDIVLGVRDSYQRFSECLFAWITKHRWGVSDPLCGMKGYRIHLYRERGYFDTYGSIGTELTIYAAINGKKIVEVPVETQSRLDGSRFGNIISANKKIIRALVLSFFVT